MKTAAVRAKPPAAQVGTHERQARHLAARFMRGDTHIGHAVAPTHSATFLLPASAGSPLPVRMRQELEHAFDADLSRVLLHTDSTAAAWADGFGARAFTAGTHIYFSGGMYRPDRAGGQELLAHEIVHVLQQTGRRSSNGLLVALHSAGPGLLQCAPAFADVRRLHAGAQPERDSYAAIADALSAIDGDRDAVIAFVETRRKTLAKLSDEELSLLYDVAKRAGAFDLAADLIELDNFRGGLRISTTIYRPEVDEALVKRSLGEFVFERAIRRIPALQLYFSEWLRLVEMGLLQPIEAKTPPLLRNLDPAAGAKSRNWESIQDHDAAVAHSYKGTQLTVNEWYLWGLRRLRVLDDSRVLAFHKARQGAYKVKTWSRWVQRVALVEQLRAWVDELKVAQASPGALPEHWQPFHTAAAEGVERILDKVHDVWATVEEYDQARRALEEARERGETPDVETEAQWSSIRSMAKSTGLVTQLSSMLEVLNASDRKRNRVPSNYVAISVNQGEALAALVKKHIEGPVLYWFRKGRTKELVAALWLQKELERVLRILQWRWSPFRLPQQGGVATPAGPEFVQAHRIQIAQFVAALGRHLGLKTLENAADVILLAQREPESVLALLPDSQGNLWYRDEVSAERMIRDFSGVPLRGQEPLRAYHLVLLYQSQYLEELKAKLEARLPLDPQGERDAVQSGSLGPNIIGTSAREVRDEMELRGDKPQRWHLGGNWRQTYFAGKKGGRSFGTLLSEHLHTQAFYTGARQRGMDGFMPLEYPGEAYVWLWPPHPSVVTLLRQISVLNEVVALKRYGSRDATAVQRVITDPIDAKWLDDVHAVLGVQSSVGAGKSSQLPKAELDDLLKKVDTFFEAYRHGAQTDLEKSYHTATRIDRQRLAARVRSSLAVYEQDSKRTNLAMEQAAAMQMFYSSLLVLFGEDVATVTDPDTGHQTVTIPAASRPRLHLAALMLEVADVMHAAFKKERKGVVVHEYLGLMDEGLASAQELYARAELARRTYLPPNESGDAWVASRLGSLHAITSQFRQYRETLQKSAGFVADEPTNVLNVALRFSDPIPAGTVLLPRTGYGLLGADPTGQRYRFVRVVRSFQYHPEWGDRQEQSRVSAPTGYGSAMVLEPDGSGPLATSPGEPLLIVEELDRSDNVIREIRVTGDKADLPLLASIYSGAVYWAFGSSMGNVQAAIEKYVNTLVDLAELIPGWGKLITAAKIVAAIADFWSQDIYKDMVAVVNGDMKLLFTGLVDKMAEVAKPGALLELFLFGDPHLDALLASSTDIGSKEDAKWARKPEVTRQKLGGLKATFAAVRKLGKAFARALRKLHGTVQQPMQDTREYVSTRPALSFALHFAAAHVYDLDRLASPSAAIVAMMSEKEQTDTSLRDDLRRTLAGEQAELGARLHALLERLGELELPERLVDITPAVQYVLDELVIFVGNRLGLQGKVVVMILTKSGVLDFFTSRIAHELVSSGFDPNVYWRDEVIPTIADSFNAARDSLITDINRLLKSEAFDGRFTPIALGKPLTLEPNTDQPYPELLQPFPSRDRELVAHPRRIPAVGAGTPLPEESRAAFERGFGVDFRHVRVHTGSAGDDMTRAFGAEALTSGSHIFLRAGLDVRGGAGADVMRHELAHTVQQTGAQPLGRQRRPDPRPARPERGLDFDPGAEADATRLAASVRAGVTSGTVPSKPDERGVQPYTLENLDPYLLARILRGFNKVEELKDQQVELDKAKTVTALARTEDTTAIEALRTALDNVKKKSSKVPVHAAAVFNGPIDASGGDKTPVLDKILAELDKKLEPDAFKKVMFRIAAEAQDDIKHPRKKGKATPKLERYVNPGHLVRQLEGYIFAKTGIALALDLKTSTFKGSNGDTLKQLDAANPLAGVKVLHVYLPYIAPNADLSTFAIKNTWPAARTDEKLRGQLSGLVRSHLSGLGVKATVWALFGTTYQFSTFLKRDIDAMMSAKLTEGGVLDPDDLTPPEIYADPDLSKSQTSPIGVRVATYGHRQSQKGPGRHSHHLTQFLIADYFANANETKQPFHPDRKYPGVEFDGDIVRYISADPTATGSGIKVGETFGSKSSRGAAMPAISLAASTHMSGDLHITPAPDDLSGTVKKTQAHAVDRTFRDGLPKELRANAPRADFNRYLNQHSPTDAAKKIHSAVQGTFQKWSRHMNDQLLANVPRLELAYYVAMAACNGKNTAVKTCATNTGEQQKLLGLLQDATKEAVQQNYKEMALYNWKQS